MQKIQNRFFRQEFLYQIQPNHAASVHSEDYKTLKNYKEVINNYTHTNSTF